MIFWPREKGEPIFPKGPRENPLAYLEGLALKRGLPYPRAREWARQEIRKYGKRSK